MNNIKNVILLIAFLVPFIVCASPGHQLDCSDPDLARTSPRRSLCERIAPILTQLSNGVFQVPATHSSPTNMILLAPTPATPIQALLRNLNFAHRSKSAQPD